MSNSYYLATVTVFQYPADVVLSIYSNTQYSLIQHPTIDAKVEVHGKQSGFRSGDRTTDTCFKSADKQACFLVVQK